MSLIASSLNTITSVCIGCLLGGGVLIILKSRAPIKLNWSVLGIGVAVSVNESTVVRSCFNFSFAVTPNFCSSSIIIKPKSLNCTSLLNIACVPMMISIFPSATFLSVSFFSFAVLNRLIKSTVTGKSFNRSPKVL